MYYGDGGFISQVMAGMNATLKGQAITMSSGATNSQGLSGSQHHGMAEGGTIVANRPTTVTFGENNEWEAASFTPIGRTGKDVNKIFSQLGKGSADGMGGMVTIALDLSPDLEARITNNTMTKTARIITQVRRTK
jgi:hypothetical protein